MPATPPSLVDDNSVEPGTSIDSGTAASEAMSEAAAPAIPAFRFPFNPAAFAKVNPAGNYPGAGKSNHDKTPGRAPNGTRRSMGKR